MTDNSETAGSVSYIQDCAHQAGLETKVLAMADIGRTRRARSSTCKASP